MALVTRVAEQQLVVEAGAATAGAHLAVDTLPGPGVDLVRQVLGVVQTAGVHRGLAVHARDEALVPPVATVAVETRLLEERRGRG